MDKMRDKNKDKNKMILPVTIPVTIIYYGLLTLVSPPALLHEKA